MGDDLYAPRPANPKGFFENHEINSINERILSQVLPARPKGFIGDVFFRKRPGEGQLWLARVPLGTSIRCPEAVVDRIRALTTRQPFCFKDPRFSYTLPCWRPLMNDARFVVVFRHPADTAMSIAKECADAPYLHTLSISREAILDVWRLMYRHILEMQAPDESWLFLHYDQMLDQKSLDRLETFADTAVDRSFPDRSLRRSRSSEPVSSETDLVYQKLCKLAHYQF
jgi:hypothetical protein